MKTNNYECFNCHKNAVASSAPVCCGEKMIEVLKTCTSAPHAEMARNSDADEPCDDGRDG